MKTKHIFVPVLDVGEILPFGVRNTKSLNESFNEQERAKEALVWFIDTLEKQLGESIFYMGMDIISEKSYERFMLKEGGFLEIMIEPPVAINAHFTTKRRAKTFEGALRKTLKKILPSGPMTEDFIMNIEVQDEQDTSLTVDKWNKLKEIHGSE